MSQTVAIPDEDIEVLTNSLLPFIGASVRDIAIVGDANISDEEASLGLEFDALDEATVTVLATYPAAESKFEFRICPRNGCSVLSYEAKDHRFTALLPGEVAPKLRLQHAV